MRGNQGIGGRAVFVVFAVASMFFALANGCATGPAEQRSESTGRTRQALGPLDLAIVGATVAPRVAPNGSLAVSITLTNTGTNVWSKSDVTLALQGEGTWTNATLALPNDVAAGANVTVTGNLGASTQIGLYTLTWRATSTASGVFGSAIVAKTEVTCSDGIFCNGDERWVNGACVAGPAPCDDGQACTTSTCDEATKLCNQILGANCAMCAAKNCNPKCNGALCGDDGCGGSCGACPAGQACASGACVVAATPGTCASPLPIVTGGDPNAVVGAGVYSTTGDNTDGFDEIIPACDPIPAPEKVYKLVINQTMGIDAQSHDIDTVLSIHSGSCGGALVKCSDDAAPPGNFGSHVWGMLTPGTYYIAVNGFDTHAVGPFTLDIRLVPGCVPQCDGKFCGDDGCGGVCATCAAGQICNTASRCVDDPCVPKCGGRQCGDDGCGGSCGDCQAGKACDPPTGSCKNAPSCDHLKPVCPTPCATKEYCGTDCACHKSTDPRPDLVVDKTRLQNEIVFDQLNVSPSSCTVVEKCVGGTGLRDLLRFTVEAINQGSATLTVPPPKTRPDLFQFSSCHGHYHFNGFASYALTDAAGNLIVAGQKLAYCMEDTERVLGGPDVGCDKKFDCENQGIQAGWADIYGNSLDCQWLDITGVPPGNYFLSVSVNPARAFEESSFDNNTTTVPVTIPAKPGDAGAPDSGSTDAGTDASTDSGATDSGATDSGSDASTNDGGSSSSGGSSSGGSSSGGSSSGGSSSGTASSSGGSSSGGSSSGTASSSGATVAPATDKGSPEGSGCDCREAPGSGSPKSALGASFLMAFVLLARRRQRERSI